MKNPALFEEVRYEPAKVIPLKQTKTLLDWLESEGRIIFREEKPRKSLEENDREIDDLMEVDDDFYGTNDDETDEDEELEEED